MAKTPVVAPWMSTCTKNSPSVPALTVTVMLV
jgi:hypothetical protein